MTELFIIILNGSFNKITPIGIISVHSVLMNLNMKNNCLKLLFLLSIIGFYSCDDDKEQIESALDGADSSTTELIETGLTKSFMLDFQASAQDDIYNKNGWRSVPVVGSQHFTTGTYRGKYLQIQGHNSESDTIVTYFVSPELNLSKKEIDKNFQFLIERDYSSDETLELLICDKYDSIHVAQSNWKNLSFHMPEKAYGWGQLESSGIVDLSAYKGKIRLAFKYVGDNHTNTGTFRLDEIKFYQQTNLSESGPESTTTRPLTADSVYYRTLSTQAPSWGTYGIPKQPTWGYVKPNYSQDFYSSIDGLSGEALKTELKKICQVKASRTSYARYRYTATDEDPRNTKNVILIYIGTSVPKTSTNQWNREHVFACSNGGYTRGKSGGGADNHHIRCSDPKENSRRGNLKLGIGYIPRAAVRGDVARMSFYVSLMYSVDPTKNLDLQWALKQNLLDKVDDWEMRINNVVEQNQGNRNPFIDHPELVDYIYGNRQNMVYHLSK